MNTRENAEKAYMEANSHIYEPIEEHQDEKVRMIYERYHEGKTIILDDLRYLWLKDPEGCKKLTKSIIEAKSKQSKAEEPEKEQELNNLIDIGTFSKKTEEIIEQHNYIDVIAGYDVSPNSQLPQVNIQDILSSMKLVLETMSESDLMEMWNHINEALVLEKIGDKMKHWNEAVESKIMMYSYEVEKKFNMLA
jgi:hypothetical protein